jgi:hypothetical protein
MKYENTALQINAIRKHVAGRPLDFSRQILLKYIPWTILA